MGAADTGKNWQHGKPSLDGVGESKAPATEFGRSRRFSSIR
jgi:hypothetical protein